MLKCNPNVTQTKPLLLAITNNRVTNRQINPCIRLDKHGFKMARKETIKGAQQMFSMAG